jgi:hypothetical protein
MSHPDPAAALNGVQTGHICDSCNRQIQHGEKAGMYATWYDKTGGRPAEPGVRTAALERLTQERTAQMRYFFSASYSHTVWSPLPS